MTCRNEVSISKRRRRVASSVAGWAVLFALAGALGSATAADTPKETRQAEAKTTKVIHKVKLADPVFASKPARVHSVVEVRRPDGLPVEYVLSIQIQVCTDGKCRVVSLVMHWDALGYFQRLELPPNKPLTKKEHTPFTAEDYAKLDQILKDRASILGTYSLDFLAKPPAKKDDGDPQESPVEGQDADAWTQPTPVTVQESVVKDAAYTTWALWRWANGEIVPKLRGFTEEACRPRDLKEFLRSSDPRFVAFALHLIQQRSPEDLQFQDDVVYVLEHGDRELVDMALRYLTRAVKDEKKLHACLIRSCPRMRSNYNRLVLDYFADQSELPTSTLEGLTGCLAELPYFQVHLILRMLEAKGFSSAKATSDVVALLGSNDFFIARRASEYLQKQDLDSQAEGKLKAFLNRNRERL